MKIKHINGTYAVLRYAADAAIPVWATGGDFFSITKTGDELSIVCESARVESNVPAREDDWQCLKVLGPLDFALTGILSSITAPLATAKISLFAVSTFDTDYILIKSNKIEEAKTVLQNAGFDVE